MQDLDTVLLLLFAVSPVCGASWARTEDICFKMITVADAEVAEVTQAANEVDYTTAKVIGLEIMITCK